jgi:hypothetical protein
MRIEHSRDDTFEVTDTAANAFMTLVVGGLDEALVSAGVAVAQRRAFGTLLATSSPIFLPIAAPISVELR